MKLCFLLPLVLWAENGSLTVVEGNLFSLKTLSSSKKPLHVSTMDAVTPTSSDTATDMADPIPSLLDRPGPDLSVEDSSIPHATTMDKEMNDSIPSLVDEPILDLFIEDRAILSVEDLNPLQDASGSDTPIFAEPPTSDMDKTRPLFRRLQAGAQASPEHAFQVRKDLNAMYGELNTGKYGAETRTTMRYNPGVAENLCVYYDKGQTFQYTMGNWELSTGYLEPKVTYDMEWVYDSATQGDGNYLNIKRPVTPKGYYRLGDVAYMEGTSPAGAVVVKAVGEGILAQPTDFEEVWNDANAGGGIYAGSSSWKPVSPSPDYVCMGHVWTLGSSKPSTDLIRCVHKKYVVPVTASVGSAEWREGINSDIPASLWQVSGSSDTTLSPGTFISYGCYICDPPIDEFYALKKKCLAHWGQFPFCLHENRVTEPNATLTHTHTKQFTIHYAKLLPCRIEQEDRTIYGLEPKKNDWEKYAVEIYRNANTEFVGYKHYGASEMLGEPYCLGNRAFGSSKLHRDEFINELPAEGNINYTSAEALMESKETFGGNLTDTLDGDFVFLFPCDKHNETMAYKKQLQDSAADANGDGKTRNGVSNEHEFLGQAANFGYERWRHPHYCQILEEPGIDSGELCDEVDECLYTPGDCKEYDSMPCSGNQQCVSSLCDDDGMCGQHPKLFGLQKLSAEVLRRPVPYGVLQDGPGDYVVGNDGKKVTLYGNTWKAFPIQRYEISSRSVLEFDFQVETGDDGNPLLAEGHAICLDEDLEEDVEVHGEVRCIRLDGTDHTWSEVWEINKPPTGTKHHYKIFLGDIFQGPKKETSYITVGTVVKYLALVQDNDADPTAGESMFSNLQLYEEKEVISGNSLICERRKELNDLYGAGYRGCWRDSANRAMSLAIGRHHTIESCAHTCKNRNYEFAAIQDRDYCFCGDSYDKHGKAKEGDCKLVCNDGKLSCGGGYRNSVWKVSSFPIASATLIDFEDLSTTGHPPVPGGYKGFAWTNIHFISKNNQGWNGYGWTDTPGKIVAWKNGGGHTGDFKRKDNSLFTLKSTMMSAPWQKNVEATIKGFNAQGHQVASRTLTLVGPGTTQRVTFDKKFKDIAKVSISGTGGVYDPSVNNLGCADNSCTHFIMDDIVVETNENQLGAAPPTIPTGPDSRTVLRYKGDDNTKNMCLYAEPAFTFQHTLANVEIKNRKAIDTTYRSGWDLKFSFRAPNGSPATFFIVDRGISDSYRGWYDPTGTGICNEYCRWVGINGSGGNPRYKVIKKDWFFVSRWTCQTSFLGSRTFESSFTASKCSHQNQVTSAAPTYKVWKPRELADSKGKFYPHGEALLPSNQAANTAYTSHNAAAAAGGGLGYQVVRGKEGLSVKTPHSSTKLYCFGVDRYCAWKLEAGFGFECTGLVFTEGNTAPSFGTRSKYKCVSESITVPVSYHEDFQIYGPGVGLKGARRADWSGVTTFGSTWIPPDGCGLTRGDFPYCGGDFRQTFADRKTFSLAYGKFKPCAFAKEDKSIYGMINEDSEWEKYTVELYKNNAGETLYRHIGMSKQMGEPYCVGDAVFGKHNRGQTLRTKSKVPVHESSITADAAKAAISSDAGTTYTLNDQYHLNTGDENFVLFFPCEPDSANSAHSMEKHANFLSTQCASTDTGLGEWRRYGADLLGGPSSVQDQTSFTKDFTVPHYCQFGGSADQCGLEPFEDTGGCLEVDTCFYDGSACGENAFCQSDGSSCECETGYLSHLEGTTTFFSANPADYCVRSDQATEQVVGPESFTMNVVPDASEYYKTDMKRLDLQIPEAELVPVKKYEDEVFKAVADGCELATWDIIDEGYDDDYKGWYDPLGCGICNQYCRWVGGSGSGGDPSLKLHHGGGTWKPSSYWSCQTSATNKYTTMGTSFPFKRCAERNDETQRRIFQKEYIDLIPGTKYTTTATAVDQNGNVLANRDEQFTSIVTPCCCPDEKGKCKHEKIRGDTSGRPINLEVLQEEGQVMFSFQDNSMCENAFAFTRAEVGNEFLDVENEAFKHVFTRNYNYLGKDPCDDKTIDPGLEAADNLFRSKLDVNKHYRYCVRAVADLYSADYSGFKNMTVMSSDETCRTHVVSWQASIDGIITTAPEAGRLPIEDVKVTWELLNKKKTHVIDPVDPVTQTKKIRSAKTGAAGKFEINFDEIDRDLDRVLEQPIRIKFSKITKVHGQEIKHRFLCQDGDVDCTEDGTITYLKHLAFGQSFAAFDATTVPVRGRVFIMEADGCPLIGAEVCLDVLKDRFGAALTIACTQTDDAGDFVLAANIGTRIGLRVSFEEHDIVQAPENYYDYFGGVFIDPSRRYERNDFIDRQKNAVAVEIAGGMCNKKLGSSTVDVKINGCSFWQTTIQQKAVDMVHMLPAHVLDLQVTEVAKEVEEEDGSIIRTKLTRITEFFMKDSNIKTIELQQLKTEKAELPADSTTGDDTALASGDPDAEAEVDEVNKAKKVRFQFDGDIQMNLKLVTGITLGNQCTQGDFFRGDVDMIVSSDNATVTDTQGVGHSLALVETLTPFTAEVDLFYEILPGVTCSKVSPDTTVRFVNKVGVDRFFDQWLFSDKEKMVKCSGETGCKQSVEHDPISGEDAHVKAIFHAGRPNIYDDLQKDFIVEALDKDNEVLKKHHAQVIVTGDYLHGSSGESIALPTYEPLVVLRDPPGGLSTATYENVQSTIRVTSEDYEVVKYVGGDAAPLVGYEAEGDAILGTPFGGANIKITKADGQLFIGGGGEKHTVKQHKEDVKTVAYTTTWSYTTSDDPELAGRLSDVLVIPTLYVELFNTDEIVFDPANCSTPATKQTKVKFAVDEKLTAMSFLNVYHIDEIQVPKIEKTKGDVIDELEPEDPDKKPTLDREIELKEQLAVLNEAIAGWTSTMAAYEASTAKAWASDAMVPREWFSKWASQKETGYGNDDPSELVQHWSALAPQVLAKRAAKKNVNYNPTTRDRRLSSDIENTDIVHFSGGGSTVTFEVSHEGMSELTNLDPSVKSKDKNDYFQTDGEGFVVIGAPKVGARFSVQAGKSTDRLGLQTKESDFQTTISFELGDEQQDDEFVVELAVDEIYGTFIFKTLGGTSSMPHEVNTTYGEILELEWSKPTKPVLPDEPLVFTITVKNVGKNFAECGLGLDQSTNSKGLLHRFGGQNTETEFSIGGAGAATSFTTTLEVFRGPRGYLFEPTWIDLFATWDSYEKSEGQRVQIWNWEDPDTGKLWLRYEEPCPRVEWVGKLGREKKTVVNKALADSTDSDVDLSILNPRKNDGGSLEVMRGTGRLQTVLVKYREVGTVQWKAALIDTAVDGLKQIDFAIITELTKGVSNAVEDDYGYALIPWKISERIPLLDDGTYEVVIESTCKELSGAPAEFNVIATEPVQVVLDRVRPLMYGKALPISDVVVLGEEVAMIFTEPINCELPYQFDITVRLSGRADDDYYSKQDLNIFCHERKLGFQFEISRLGIRPDDVVGRDLTVTVENIADLQGNLVEWPIEFTMAMANLKLRQAATEFSMTITTDTGTCSPDIIQESTVRDAVALQLGLRDKTRIEIPGVECKGNDMVAQLRIVHPEVAPPQRRLGSPETHADGLDNDHLTPVDAYNALMKASELLKDADRSQSSRKLARRLANSTFIDGGVPFTLGNFKLIPGPEDIKQFALDAAPTQEEDMILAVARGLDPESLNQREFMLRLANNHNATEKRLTELDEHISELDNALEARQDEMGSQMDELAENLEKTDQHIDAVAAKQNLHINEKLSEHQEETHEQINQLAAKQDEFTANQSAHMEDLDQKVDLLLAQILKKQGSGDRTLHLHDEEEFQEMKHFLLRLEVVSALLSAILVVCLVVMSASVRKAARA